jgi:hypothetical protein
MPFTPNLTIEREVKKIKGANHSCFRESIERRFLELQLVFSDLDRLVPSGNFVDDFELDLEKLDLGQ